MSHADVMGGHGAGKGTSRFPLLLPTLLSLYKSDSYSGELSNQSFSNLCLSKSHMLQGVPEKMVHSDFFTPRIL